MSIHFIFVSAVEVEEGAMALNRSAFVVHARRFLAPYSALAPAPSPWYLAARSSQKKSPDLAGIAGSGSPGCTAQSSRCGLFHASRRRLLGCSTRILAISKIDAGAVGIAEGAEVRPCYRFEPPTLFWLEHQRVDRSPR